MHLSISQWGYPKPAQTQQERASDSVESVQHSVELTGQYCSEIRDHLISFKYFITQKLIKTIDTLVKASLLHSNETSGEHIHTYGAYAAQIIDQLEGAGAGISVQTSCFMNC